MLPLLRQIMLLSCSNLRLLWHRLNVGKILVVVALRMAYGSSLTCEPSCFCMTSSSILFTNIRDVMSFGIHAYCPFLSVISKRHESIVFPPVET